MTVKKLCLTAKYNIWSSMTKAKHIAQYWKLIITGLLTQYLSSSPTRLGHLPCLDPIKNDLSPINEGKGSRQARHA